MKKKAYLGEAQANPLSLCMCISSQFPAIVSNQLSTVRLSWEVYFEKWRFFFSTENFLKKKLGADSFFYLFYLLEYELDV